MNRLNQKHKIVLDMDQFEIRSKKDKIFNQVNEIDQIKILIQRMEESNVYDEKYIKKLQ